MIAIAVVLTGCGAARPSATPIASGDGTAESDGATPGAANVQAAADLLPQRVGGGWLLLESDPIPSPQQFDAWARDLHIAVVFDAAVAVAEYDGQNHVSITVFAAPDQRLHPQLGNGSAFAERWIAAYACDRPRRIVLAGTVLIAMHAYEKACRNQYLVVFREQLVVIEDGPDMTQRPLDESTFAPLVAAIMERAE